MSSSYEQPRATADIGRLETGMQARWKIRPMKERDARAIAAWRYPAPYDFYDVDRDPADLAELLDPVSWRGTYFAAVTPAGELAGFFVFKWLDHNTVSQRA